MAAGVSWQAVQLRQANISDRVALNICKFYFCRSSISSFREKAPPKRRTINTVFAQFFNCLKLFIVTNFWETTFFIGRVKEERWTKKNLENELPLKMGSYKGFYPTPPPPLLLWPSQPYNLNLAY